MMCVGTSRVNESVKKNKTRENRDHGQGDSGA